MVEIIEHSFNSAKEFLNALRLSNNEWWTFHSVTNGPDSNWQRDWIFRGESSTNQSDNWIPLLPSVWRASQQVKGSVFETVRASISEHIPFRLELDAILEDKRFRRLGIDLSEDENRAKTNLIREATISAFTEVTLVNEFINLADELGFRVARLPHWTETFEFVRRYIDLYFPDVVFQIHRQQHEALGVLPSPEQEQVQLWANESVALAQHHGVPTRLLDWTRNPLYAAYFAASKVDNVDVDDYIAVYAFNRQMARNHIRLVQVPSSDNDFFRAQSGVFTLDGRAEELFLLNGHYPKLEESLKYVGGIYSEILFPKCLTLPVSETPELLRLLWIERVTEAHLMPTLDHVASAVKTKILVSDKIAPIQNNDN